jgi:hypothetical protein
LQQSFDLPGGKVANGRLKAAEALLALDVFRQGAHGEKRDEVERKELPNCMAREMDKGTTAGAIEFALVHDIVFGGRTPDDHRFSLPVQKNEWAGPV